MNELETKRGVLDVKAVRFHSSRQTNIINTHFSTVVEIRLTVQKRHTFLYL